MPLARTPADPPAGTELHLSGTRRCPRRRGESGRILSGTTPRL